MAVTHPVECANSFTVRKGWDFRHEVTAMAELMAELGHEMEQTPRRHPERAGCGIEYSWGKSKLFFRRNNDFSGNAKNLEARVDAAPVHS